jgi:hypothetical protein
MITIDNNKSLNKQRNTEKSYSTKNSNLRILEFDSTPTGNTSSSQNN